LDVIAKNGVTMLVDNYGANISVKLNRLADALKTRNIKYNVRNNHSEDAHCNGWFDTHTFSDSPKSYGQSKALYASCLQTQELRCNPIIDGKIYICPVYDFLVEQSLLSYEPRYVFDLFDDTMALEDKKNKMINFINLDYQPSCAYCNGFLPDAERYIPAVQLL
jgi:hypothetical protein